MRERYLMINKIKKVTKVGKTRTKKQKAIRATMAKRKSKNSPELYEYELTKQNAHNYGLFINESVLADDLEKAREELYGNDTAKTYSKRKY